MKIKQASDNGNVECIQNYSENVNWISRNRVRSDSYHNNYNSRSIQEDNLTYDLSNTNTNNDTVIGYNDTTVNHKIVKINNTSNSLQVNVNADLVFNNQYKINVKNNINLVNTDNKRITKTTILETLTETAFTPCDSYQGNINVSQSTANTGVRAFENSDTDEIFENGKEHIRVPRGIVNPNYPGFQHYADTLQDYSSNIENFYHSENDMTDDDIDVDIVDTLYDVNIHQTAVDAEELNSKNNNNFNRNESNTTENIIANYSGTTSITNKIENDSAQEVPDLLKNVTKLNNNNNEITYNYLNCSDADIENNFHTKEIIGDFNKEIEDEIKHLLNYNINVEHDLEELRKDIKDTFAKPIENTINNISEVVNHVIKKLVESQYEPNDALNKEIGQYPEATESCNIDTDDSKICRKNETNCRKEMNLSRPTFLLIHSNVSNKISDAFLSDGKDEINIYEEEHYDTEKLSNNVEHTIKQLSTELRKIIPKLDELRERETLWADNKCDSSMNTDGNSNEIPSTSKANRPSPILRTDFLKQSRELDEIVQEKNGDFPVRRPKSKHKVASRPRASRERKTDMVLSSASNIKSTSVRKNGSIDDYNLGSFDVYNIETAMPPLDIDTIENHLKAAKEAERRKRNDREEIRRRLAMGADTDEYYSMGHSDRPGKKPSLHSRMQNGKNLQICFMNETASDNESQASDVERNVNCKNKDLAKSSIFSKSNYSLNNHPYQTRPLSVNITNNDRLSSMQIASKLRPTSLTLKSIKSRSSHSLGHIEIKESDFHTLQATLQIEARFALAQAKEMARIQMEQERRARAASPVTEMLRRSMQKAGAPLAADRRRVSRQLLTDMNIAQLQVIVNELHSQIESLNDSLVKFLMARDELHMGQDSMLVDIEDLTRYLGVKEQTKKTKGNTKSAVKRFSSLAHK